MTESKPQWKIVHCSNTAVYLECRDADFCDEARFSGPYRELSAMRFIKAQHMNELVAVSKRVCDQLDIHAKSRGYLSEDVSRLRAILVKIDGSEK